MATMRVVPQDRASLQEPCYRCQADGCPWDRLGGQALCPDCQEALAQGTGAPFIARTEKKTCMVCTQVGTLCFLTLPLGSMQALAFDLCPEHFRALIGRRLDRRTFRKLRTELFRLGLAPQHIFLLHEAFYDERGQALQPALEME